MFALLGFWIFVCVFCSIKLDVAAAIMSTTSKVILRNIWIFLVPIVGYAVMFGYLYLQFMAFFYMLTRGNVTRHSKDGSCDWVAKKLDPIAENLCLYYTLDYQGDKSFVW